MNRMWEGGLRGYYAPLPSHPRILLETTDLGQEVMKIFCRNKNETWNDCCCHLECGLT